MIFIKAALRTEIDVSGLNLIGGCPGIYRDGFLFVAGSKANIFDALVIRNPYLANCWSPRFPATPKSLEEHISLVNRYQLERAVVIAQDIEFLKNCPSLQFLRIIPADTAPPNFDYSPLYQMQNVTELSCTTKYGGCKEPFQTVIDYSKIQGLCAIHAEGNGHFNLGKATHLKILSVSQNKSFANLQTFDSCVNLQELNLLQCSVKNLGGIERFRNLKILSVNRCLSLTDMSNVAECAPSLQTLCVENCAKIKDFSFLFQLKNLEHLVLLGSNKLPDLAFLSSMKKLKTLTFSMEVENGDLTPCLSVPYVDCLKARHYYNLKNQNLPKQNT